jgi:hypothetical protein
MDMEKSIGETPAKVIYRYYLIYREYLLENSISDDSNSITTEDLLNFVQNNINFEDRLRLADKIWN